MDSLIAWWRHGQQKDFTLHIQEWENALRTWRTANTPRCKHGEFFDSCSTCLTHQQITAMIM